MPAATQFTPTPPVNSDSDVRRAYQVAGGRLQANTTGYNTGGNPDKLVNVGINLTGETHLIRATGTFGSGTLKVQRRVLIDDTANTPGGQWTDVPNASWTSAGELLIANAVAAQYRVILTGATSPDILWDITAPTGGQPGTVFYN